MTPIDAHGCPLALAFSRAFVRSGTASARVTIRLRKGGGDAERV